MARAYNGDKWISHLWCRITKWHIVYTHRKKSKALPLLKKALAYIRTILKGNIQFLRLDGEHTLGDKFNTWISDKGIKEERVAYPDTPEQNFAEPGGKLLTTLSRLLRIQSQLPSYLWPEFYYASEYLLNRMPTKSLGYKTPFEAVFYKLPRMAHLEIYGYKAFTLIKHIPKLQQLDPRAYIGYLIR